MAVIRAEKVDSGQISPRWPRAGSHVAARKGLSSKLDCPGEVARSQQYPVSFTQQFYFPSLQSGCERHQCAVDGPIRAISRKPLQAE